jgi:hypothetical protein
VYRGPGWCGSVGSVEVLSKASLGELTALFLYNAFWWHAHTHATYCARAAKRRAARQGTEAWGADNHRAERGRVHTGGR